MLFLQGAPGPRGDDGTPGKPGPQVRAPCLPYLVVVNYASSVTLLLFQGEHGTRGFPGSDGDPGDKVWREN